jgi:hypothetical protein
VLALLTLGNKVRYPVKDKKLKSNFMERVD